MPPDGKKEAAGSPSGRSEPGCGRFWEAVAFALYALLIGLIGFLLTTFVFLILWMWVIEGISWRQIAAVSIGVTLVLYLIFGYFLEVPLPGGIFS